MLTPPKELHVWNDWHTSKDVKKHLTLKAFDAPGAAPAMIHIYHVYENGSISYEGHESVTSLAQRGGETLSGFDFMTGHTDW